MNLLSTTQDHKACVTLVITLRNETKWCLSIISSKLLYIGGGI